MPIRLLLEHDHSFGPEEIAALAGAFDEALATLGLVHREDPATILVAKTIITLAKDGERDPVRLRDIAIKLLSAPPNEPNVELHSQGKNEPR